MPVFDPYFTSSGPRKGCQNANTEVIFSGEGLKNRGIGVISEIISYFSDESDLIVEVVLFLIFPGKHFRSPQT
jgi:hypothetical protein